jgi:hypothetical protein
VKKEQRLEQVNGLTDAGYAEVRLHHPNRQW